MRSVGWLALAIAFCGSSAVAQDSADPAAGHEFARSVCAECHAVESDGGDSPNLLAPTFRRIAAEPGMTATALSVILRNPHREMPDFILAPDDRGDVIAYILTLRPGD